MDINKNNNAFRVFLGLIITTLIVGAFNYPIVQTLSRHSFDDGTYSHAYLIPFISLYLYYYLVKNGKITFRLSFSFIAALSLILCCIGLYLVTNAQISLLYWIIFLLTFIAALNVIFQFSWHLIFPAAYLVFLFPIWGILTPFLQSLSVKAVTIMMGFTGIPTFVEGQFITIPAGTFEIANGCSGLRYFIVSIAISSLFAFIYLKENTKRFYYLSIAIIGALVTNWVRITTLILIGEYTNMESSLMNDHNMFGWYLYVPFMFAMFYWGNKIADQDLLSSNAGPQLKNALPSYLNILVLTICIALSSTTLKSLFIPSQSVKNTVHDSITPLIYNFVSIKNLKVNNEQDRAYSFNFNIKELDSKPTFFANNLLPRGWIKTKEEIIDGRSVVYIKSHKSSAAVVYQYQLGDKQYPTAKGLKIARLNYSYLIQDTKLHWAFISNADDVEVYIKSMATK